MGRLIDSSLWVDYFRLKTPRSVKEQVVAIVDEPDALLCEPVCFEILRATLPSERPRVEEAFATLPLLSSPADLWRQATRLGQSCRDRDARIPAFDLFIAQVCLQHRVEIVTFDPHFAEIAQVCALQVHLLKRAV